MVDVPVAEQLSAVASKVSDPGVSSGSAAAASAADSDEIELLPDLLGYASPSEEPLAA